MYEHKYSYRAEAQKCSRCGEDKNIEIKELKASSSDVYGYRFSKPFPDKKEEKEETGPQYWGSYSD